MIPKRKDFPLASDVKFLFEPDPRLRSSVHSEIKTISCHKFVLALGSEVFRRMFYGDFDAPSQIVITDSIPGIFKLFIEVNIFAENILL